jgi:hypothetical protein
MDFRTHYLPSGRHKIDSFQVDEVTFRGVEKPWDFIFCILDIENSELVEVASVMFEVGEWSLQLIIWCQNVLKTTLVKSMKRSFMVSKGIANTFFESRASRNALDEVV